MRLLAIIAVAGSLLLSASLSLLGAETSVDGTVQKFLAVVKSKDRRALADTVSYPLRRLVPLPAISSPSQFVQAFDEVMDEKLLQAISSSSVTEDWAEVGWRGIMFQNGALWLDEDGKITAINYQTEKGKLKRIALIQAEKQKLHVSLRDFVEPVLEWETAKYRIRIDQIANDKFRYAAWPVQRKTSEKPDLILLNGAISFDGSGGNHHYDFKSGSVLYRCLVNELGAADTPPGELEVYKHEKVVLSQPVLKVIKGW